MSEMGHIEDQAAARALSALPLDEEAQVDRHVEACPTCNRILQEASETAHMLALAVQPARPPGHCKQRLMARIDREQFLQRPGRRRSVAAPFQWAIAGAFVLGLAFWNVQLHRELNHRRMLEQVVVGDPQPSSLEHEDPAASTAKGRMYMQPDGTGAVLIVENLEPAPPGMVYQIWVADEDRQQPMETFQAAGATEWLMMRASEPLTHFKWIMITLENGAGKKIPSGKTILRGDL
jgi:hypothetical protein